MRKLLTIFLCILTAFCLYGCGAATSAMEPPATNPAVTESPAAQLDPRALYQQAAAQLGKGSVTLDVAVEKTVSVGQQRFCETIEQTLTWSGSDYASTETIRYGQEEPHTCEEIHSGGTVYLTLDELCFSGSLSAEEALSRHIPAVLLDDSLYGSIGVQETEEGTALTFEEPSAAEFWALPEGAELMEAFGSAVVDEAGVLRQMQYTIIYAHVSATHTVEVTSRPRAKAEGIPRIADGNVYTPIASVDAPRMALGMMDLLKQSESLTADCGQYILSYAADLMDNQVVEISLYGEGADFTGAFGANVIRSGFWGNNPAYYQARATFRDGVYTENGEAAEGSEAHLRNTCYEYMSLYFVEPKYWEDAVIEDMGSAWLIEIQTNQEFVEWCEEKLGRDIWNDTAFLGTTFDDYEINEIDAYLSVDKFTGLPMNSGLTYWVDYLKDGYEYVISLEMAQKIDVVSPFAYYNVTLEYPEEEIPEGEITPLFYSVTGQNGQKMWLFPATGVGDARMTVLPQQIMEAYDSADAVMLGTDAEGDWRRSKENNGEIDENLIEYYYHVDSRAEDHMDVQTFEQLRRYSKALGMNQTNVVEGMKPLLNESHITAGYECQADPLSANYGTYYWIGALSRQKGKEVREVQSQTDGVKALLELPIEVQLYLLKQTMDADGTEMVQSYYDSYEAWCSGDEDAFREMIGDAQDWDALPEEDRRLMEPYYQYYLDWYELVYKKAVQCLESDEEIFFVVDMDACLTDEIGLVDQLRTAGYTVEQVQYTQ